MGNSLICPAFDDVNNSGRTITVAHCSEGLLLEIDPTSVAELMIEFPGHFLAHLDAPLLQELAVDRAKEGKGEAEVVEEEGFCNKSRRLSAMAAHEKTCPGQIYALLPMALLHRRLRPQHWSAIARLLRGGRGGVRSAACRSSTRATSKIAPLNLSPPEDACRSDDDAAIGVCKRQLDQGAVSGGGSNNGRQAVWTPKLETIAE